MGVNEERGPGPGVQSVHRALDLLELLSQRESAGVTELARATGLAVSTTHNLLRTLAARNYLVTDRGSYRLGSAALALSSKTDPARLLSPLIGPALDRVSEATGHSATATTLVGNSARLLGYTPGTGMITVNQTQLMWRNPLAMATGRVIVSYRPEAEWDQFITAEDHDELPQWTPQRWREEFRRIKGTGYCVKYLLPPPDESSIDFTAVAVPVRSANDEVICSIGVAVPTRLGAEGVNDILAELASVAEPIAQRLGCTAIHPKPVARHEDLVESGRHV